MTALQTFLHMGGYASYVWTAYGLAAVVLGGAAWSSRRRERRILGRLAARKTGKSA